jgi:hypothetical protein
MIGNPTCVTDSSSGPDSRLGSAPVPKRRLVRRWMRRLGWLLGAPLAIFRFLRREMIVEEIDAAPAVAPLPAAEPDGRQIEPGLGPLAHHLCAATVRAPKLAPEQLLAIIAANPNVIAPTEVLRFERPPGKPGSLQKDDELLIRMAGPWNGPMRVTERGDDRLRLGALLGHAQQGQIELRVRGHDNHNGIEIEIQTRERAAGPGFYLLQRIGLIKRMQSYTWAEMLQNAAKLAGGKPPERITVQSWHSAHETPT